ncbi:MAG: alanine acetyltransferase [Armatimonadetes bacterium]|jgi:ribosomal-protein-alanine N-acetyltransferase|nr:alanine acetyltransferase [Armatimonadota bacterium]
MDTDDVPGVCAIDAQCCAEPWAADTFERESSNHIGYYRVAEQDGELLGYIGSQVILDEAHITTFGVRPELRRRGIGERLLADVLEYAVRSGVRRITLEVREGNTGALHLYRKYGFSPVSRRPRYYMDNNEDAIVMWIEDTSRLGFRTLLAERLAALQREFLTG